MSKVGQRHAIGRPRRGVRLVVERMNLFIVKEAAQGVIEVN